MQSVLVQSKMSVVQLSGHLNASNVDALQKQLNQAVMNCEAPALLVDMSQAESLDSAGLMALVSALTLAQQTDRRFGLCGVSASIRIIFELTQLDRVFEMFENHSAFEAAIA